MTTAHNGQANRECMSISFAIGKLMTFPVMPVINRDHNK